MNDELHQAKEILTLLALHQHSPDVFAALKAKPAGIDEVIARGYDLPCSMVYVDEEDQTLVVGLSRSAANEQARHEANLQEILGEISFRITYVRIIRDDAPGKKKDCRPLWGGVRMNSDATLSVVYNLGNGQLGTILSSHAVGNNGQTGQSVGQVAKSTVYGKVTVNPSLAYRASDSALAVITNSRILGQANRIWIAPNEAYIVNDYAISDNTPVGMVLYMQGAQTEDLQRGTLKRKGVNITDSRGTLTGQILSNYSAQGGDSGAPIFYMAEVEGYIVYIGIHAGRVDMDGKMYPFYSPWESIRQELGLRQYES